MILNSFEFNLTKQKIEKIQETISEVEKDTSIDSFLLQIELDSLHAFKNELLEQRDYYLEIIQNFKNIVPLKKEILKSPEMKFELNFLKISSKKL